MTRSAIRWSAVLLAVLALSVPAAAQNQTPTVSPVLSGADLPFRVSIDLAGFALPVGLHSYVSATHGGKWLLLAGRTNGLHDFSSGTNNFPPKRQNKDVLVIDPAQGTVITRALTDSGSGLSEAQIDTLSVTSAQSHQVGSTLYMTGGYGVDTGTGEFSTKPVLTAIDVPGLMHWASTPSPGETAVQHIRQLFSQVFQITGGYMTRTRQNVTLLAFGQNFEGYYVPSSNGVYSEQVRRFIIRDDGVSLSLAPRAQVDRLAKPIPPDPSYRRRDLNVVPVVTQKLGLPVSSWVALSGVFTLAGGAWTVPVEISAAGVPSMADPSLPGTFKQGMNNYVSPTLGLYAANGNSYTVLLGGISFGFFDNGSFQTDPQLPFINQVTAIRIDPKGQYSQHLLEAEYPVILSTTVNPGNRLLFGAGAQFFPAGGVPAFPNGVVRLDRLGPGPTVVGHIVGGIQSTLPNTSSKSDSAASPYVFAVSVTRP